MARACTICGHDDVEAINQSLALRPDSIRDVAGRYGVSKSALHRHARDHLPRHLARAAEAGETARATDLLAQARQLLSDAREIQAEAMGAFDHRTALAAIREQSRVLDLLGRLLGELGAGGPVHLHAHRHEHVAAQLTPDAVERLAEIAAGWARRRRAPESIEAEAADG